MICGQCLKRGLYFTAQSGPRSVFSFPGLDASCTGQYVEERLTVMAYIRPQRLVLALPPASFLLFPSVPLDCGVGRSESLEHAGEPSALRNANPFRDEEDSARQRQFAAMRPGGPV